MAHVQTLGEFSPPNVIELMDATHAAVQAHLVTGKQWATLQKLLRPLVPVTFTLAQRTPKGTLYVDLADGQRYTIDCRAKLQKIV